MGGWLGGWVKGQEGDGRARRLKGIPGSKVAHLHHHHPCSKINTPPRCAAVYCLCALQAKNEAETAIYSAEKSLSEYKSKLPQAVADDISKAIAEARDASTVSFWRTAFDC